jgi:hypothetical protein
METSESLPSGIPARSYLLWRATPQHPIIVLRVLLMASCLGYHYWGGLSSMPSFSTASSHQYLSKWLICLKRPWGHRLWALTWFVISTHHKQGSWVAVEPWTTALRCSWDHWHQLGILPQHKPQTSNFLIVLIDKRKPSPLDWHAGGAGSWVDEYKKSKLNTCTHSHSLWLFPLNYLLQVLVLISPQWWAISWNSKQNKPFLS